ncbi:MAG: LPS export ABC transporter periplasmic protein LptC [Bacteroidales bacterium]|nr:LPS export ABC transporter periplasmic protein LptC [Bacteroidales bacterium]MCF8403072.1 LPS export ABC transporter periplasmic protein LptC [Bacteroidales bacterium]
MEDSLLYKLKIIAVKSIGIVVILFATMLFSCENDINTINSLNITDSLPNEYAKDIEVFYSDSGKIEAYLEGPLMLNITDKEEPYMEFPDGFKVIFFDSLMNEKTIITAKYGINYEKKQIMEARNNVVVRSLDKDEKLETEQLIWDRQKGLIYSEVFVKITKPDEVLFGDGLISDQSFSFYEIKNPSGEFQIYPDEK